MGKVADITNEELKVLVEENEKTIFIDFWAAWCGPCKMVEPVINELSDDYSNITFVKLNVDDNPESAATYGVRSIPTFIVIKNKELVYRHSGAVPKSFLAEKLASYVK